MSAIAGSVGISGGKGGATCWKLSMFLGFYEDQPDSLRAYLRTLRRLKTERFEGVFRTKSFYAIKFWGRSRLQSV